MQNVDKVQEYLFVSRIHIFRHNVIIKLSLHITKNARNVSAIAVVVNF